MKLIVAIIGEYGLMYWKGNSMPYVVAHIGKGHEVGGYIDSWSHGDYFRKEDFDLATKTLYQRSGYTK